MNELLKKLGEDTIAALKTALIPALKPVLKAFAHDIIELLKVEAAKTATPLDDLVIAASQPAVEKLVDDLLAKV